MLCIGGMLWRYEDKSQKEKDYTILGIYLILFVLIGFLINSVLPAILLALFGFYINCRNNSSKSKSRNNTNHS
ncbi:hypothetical protein SAMN02745118_01285 [Selenihalanaerobacter shriftii]|uniref:Uncharacterized protein n=1 Tax=Selenihalanaerobacter shriftii TaxID=142842 RepID=A0A1T4LXW0_9FIRM|nr:hypothetical protein SAMN02745118_01285 [Selenihalanaerobacter shriftii]